MVSQSYSYNFVYIYMCVYFCIVIRLVRVSLAIVS